MQAEIHGAGPGTQRAGCSRLGLLERRCARRGAGWLVGWKLQGGAQDPVEARMQVLMQRAWREAPEPAGLTRGDGGCCPGSGGRAEERPAESRSRGDVAGLRSRSRASRVSLLQPRGWGEGVGRLGPQARQDVGTTPGLGG